MGGFSKYGFVFLVCFCLSKTNVYCQLQFKQIATPSFSVSDLKSAILDNKANIFRRVVVSISCKDDSGEVFSYRMPAFLLDPGLQVYSFDDLDTNAFHFRNEYQRQFFRQNLNLPAGRYTLCYDAYSKFIQLQVLPQCLTKTSSGQSAIAKPDSTRTGPYRIDPGQFNLKSNKKIQASVSPGIDYEVLRQNYFRKITAGFSKPNLSFHGRAGISYNYNPAPLAGIYPASFLNGEVSPTLKVYGIPLAVSVLYTYDLHQDKPFFNQFNLSFNKREFQQGMMQRLGGVLEVTHPRSAMDLLAGNLPEATVKAYGNNPYSLGSFNTLDKASIQQYRYDKERLLKYRDSLEWTDPAKARNAEHLAEQMEFQNTMRLLEQQNSEQRRQFEDSLAKKDTAYLHRIKDGQSLNLFQRMRKGNFPDNPSDVEQVMPLSKRERFFYRVHSLSLGKSYFNYTPLSIMGVGVTGGDIALNLSKVYLQAGAGLLDMRQSLWFQEELSKKYIVKAARTGWGNPDKDHIHLVYVDFTSQNPNDSSQSTFGNRPNRNTILGSEAAITLFRDFSLKGEYMKSFSTYSNASATPEPSAEVFRHDALHLSSDYISSRTGTEASADLNRIGGQYYTAGNPYLRNNVFNYSLRLNQSILGRMLQFHTGLRQENDNMDGKNTVTTASRRYDLGGSFLYRKLPTLSINYLPVYFSQKVLSETGFRYFGRAETFTISSGYATHLLKRSLATTALFTHSVNENIYSRPGFNLYTYMLCETYALAPATSLRTILTMNRPGHSQDSLKNTIADISISFPLLKRGTQLLGLKCMQSPIASQYSLYTQTGLQFGKYLSGSLYIFRQLKSTGPATANPYLPSGNLVQVSVMGVW